MGIIWINVCYVIRTYLLLLMLIQKWVVLKLKSLVWERSPDLGLVRENINKIANAKKLCTIHQRNKKHHLLISYPQQSCLHLGPPSFLISWLDCWSVLVNSIILAWLPDIPSPPPADSILLEPIITLISIDINW